MSANITSRTLVLRMLLSFFLIIAVLFLIFMIDRDTEGYINFMKFFIPLSAVLFGTFIITYVILERKTSFRLRMLIAGTVSYIATLGIMGFLYGLGLGSVIFGALWAVLLGVIAIKKTDENQY